MGTAWQQLSTEIAEVISASGKSIVAVDGRGGHTSSGLVWRPDMIITAAHAIRREAGIRVLTGPEATVAARLAGRDRGSDIALLKVEQALPSPAAFGSATPLRVGDLTIAVARTRRGHLVASAGVVSGLLGEWQAHRTRIDQFIRPDLNLYPGFSGGALVGADGRILGMNTSGLLRGKPLTIPASTLDRIANELASRGHISRPYIGVVLQPVHIPESLRARAGVAATTGLLALQLEPGGPADQAGMLLGDVLIAINEESFEQLEDVHQILEKKGIGSDIQAVAIRGGQRVELGIRVGTRPAG
jgi:S1-C subfamily serine protease